MLLINIQRARAQYNDMLAEAEARRLAQSHGLVARLIHRPMSVKSLIVRMSAALRARRANRA